jgi:hypothetical protein
VRLTALSKCREVSKLCMLQPVSLKLALLIHKIHLQFQYSFSYLDMSRTPLNAHHQLSRKRKTFLANLFTNGAVNSRIE